MQAGSHLRIGLVTVSSTPTPRGSIVPLGAGRALLAVCWAVVAYGTATATPHTLGIRSLGAWAATVIYLLTFTAVIERRVPVNVLVVSGAAAVAVEFLAPGNGAYVAAIAAIAVAAIRLDEAMGRRFAILCGGGFLVVGVLSPHPLPSVAVASMTPGLLFTYLGARALGRLNVEQQRTAALLNEVIAGRDAVARAAVLDERAHLAREMHDVLAHTLSALSIQLEGTQMLAEQRSSDPEVLSAIERVSGLAREGLGEARRAVGSLRGEVRPGPDLLPHLAASFEEDTQVPCTLQIEGEQFDLPADARLALYRIAQEALTNVRRHSESTRVTLTLQYTADGVELIVENEGQARVSPLPGGGYGVSGMRERAEILHGRLEAGPTERGFRVWVWLPSRVSEPSGSSSPTIRR